MTPAILTEHETREWLRTLGLSRVRLPRNPSRVVYVDDPQRHGLWRISPGPSGGFLVEPYRQDVANSDRLVK